MRLSELRPAWLVRYGRIVGMRFWCPCCEGMIGVLFANPPDGGDPHPNDSMMPHNHAGLRWLRKGDTVDDITLRPAIDGSAESHWNGFVTRGDVEPV